MLCGGHGRSDHTYATHQKALFLPVIRIGAFIQESLHPSKFFSHNRLSRIFFLLCAFVRQFCFSIVLTQKHQMWLFRPSLPKKTKERKIKNSKKICTIVLKLNLSNWKIFFCSRRNHLKIIYAWACMLACIVVICITFIATIFDANRWWWWWGTPNWVDFSGAERTVQLAVRIDNIFYIIPVPSNNIICMYGDDDECVYVL